MRFARCACRLRRPPSSHYQAVAGGTNICSAAMCTSSFFSSSFTPQLCHRLLWQFGQGLLLLRLTHHSAIVNLPLVRRDLFQLRQQNSCGTSLRLHPKECSPHWKCIPKPLNQLETRSEAQSSWRAEGSQHASSCQQNTNCKSLHSPNDVFTRSNFARAAAAEKLRTGLQCSSPASEPSSTRAL